MLKFTVVLLKFIMKMLKFKKYSLKLTTKISKFTNTGPNLTRLAPSFPLIRQTFIISADFWPLPFYRLLAAAIEFTRLEADRRSCLNLGFFISFRRTIFRTSTEIL